MCECGTLATWAEPLHLRVHAESEDEPGVDEGAPGAEVLDSSDDMDEDDEILFEIPDGFELAPSDEPVFEVGQEGERRGWYFPFL